MKELNIKINDSAIIHFNESQGVAIICGLTGSGKSVLINSLIMNAAESYSPEELEIDYIDMKSVEAEFWVGACEIPHMHKIVGTRDSKLGMRELNSIINEISNRSMSPTKDFPMRLVIIDEYQEIGDISTHIGYIAKNGPENGVFLLLATQSVTPSNSVLDYSEIRLALRCTEEMSELLIGSIVASELPRAGSVILKQYNNTIEAQVKYYDEEALKAKALALRKQYKNSHHSIIYKKEY